jgi:hypothetical protein
MSTDVSEVRSASIIRAMEMEAARTSETSVDIQLRKRQYIPEDSELHHTVTTITLNRIITTNAFDHILGTMTLDTVVAFVIPLTALLTSSPVT